MRSKRCMASATATASPDEDRRPGLITSGEARHGGAREAEARRHGARPGRWSPGSRLGRTIIILNMLGLVILIGGVLILSELRQGLVTTRLESLVLQGDLIANVIDQTATVGEPVPSLDAATASGVLGSLFIRKSQRARLFDASGQLLADSYTVADRVEARPLPPARKPNSFDLNFDFRPPLRQRERAAAIALSLELNGALRGNQMRDLRRDDDGRRVVSVSIPIRHVRAVLGVLTLESGDVEQIIARERAALLPFILIAVGVSLLSSVLLTQLIAEPVLRLARAADSVRLSRARAIALPDLAERQDELGDLTRSLEAMTAALSERMEAIERFAADVAHELRNPMTSIRSAVETLDLVKTAEQRQRLIIILQSDVERLERLITDISNASRLDAELARESPMPLDVARLLGDISALYQVTARPGEPVIAFHETPHTEALRVSGREGPLSQVFRNLIDNARSFSPPGGTVSVSLHSDEDEVQVRIDDQGPGVPPDNLETVFERFYTSRPKGSAFGGNSGLGLAIARQIVETHGGRIWAANRQIDGKTVGARFTVALPRT